MSRFLDQIFSCRRDQYTGFPPHTLLEKCSLPANAFDPDELERAVWLWARRPGDLFFDGKRVLWGRLGLFLASIFFLVACWVATCELYRRFHKPAECVDSRVYYIDQRRGIR